jgi:predicted Mrr-cat superfamily restriction endonuclease
MRARDRDLPTGAGAAFGVAHGLVGTGDALDVVPTTFDEAVAAATDRHGEKAGRMLRRFAEVPEGAFVWTSTADGDAPYRLGRIDGPWRYDDSPAASAVGIHHVRPATWLPDGFAEDELPGAVAHTFGRGGRNFQRTLDADAERETQALWDARAPAADG